MNQLNVKKPIDLISVSISENESPLSPFPLTIESSQSYFQIKEQNHIPNSSEETTCAAIKSDQEQDQQPDKPKRTRRFKNKGKSPEIPLQITLSNHPHFIKSNKQLLRELSRNLSQDHPTSPCPSPSTSAHTVEDRIMNDLMLTMIRQLSSRLDQSKSDLARSRLETQALKSLLVDNYAVGLGEIERCLVRSKVSTHIESQTTSRWTLDIPLTFSNRSKQRTSQDYCPNYHPSPISSNLDLENLREAMYDNPCYDTASFSSSHIPSPSSFISQAPPPEDKSKISSRLFKSSSNRSSKAALLPPPIKHSKKTSSSLQIQPPPLDNNHQQKKESVESDSLSSQYNHSGTSAAVGATWGFHGWRWTNKTNSSKLQPPTSTFGKDEDEGEGKRSNPPTDESGPAVEGKDGSKGKYFDMTDDDNGEADEGQELQHPGPTNQAPQDPITNRLFANLFSRRSASSSHLVTKPPPNSTREPEPHSHPTFQPPDSSCLSTHSAHSIPPHSVPATSPCASASDSNLIPTPSTSQLSSRGEQVPTSGSFAALATPCSIDSEFILNSGSGSRRPSSCESGFSSSAKSFRLPSAPFLPPSTTGQAGEAEMIEQLLPSSHASDTSSLAVSRVLTDLALPTPTLTTADVVPEFVIDASSAAATALLSPVLQPSRKSSIGTGGNQSHMTIGAKSLANVPTTAASRESPFCHSSPPGILHPRGSNYSAVKAPFKSTDGSSASRKSRPLNPVKNLVSTSEGSSVNEAAEARRYSGPELPPFSSSNNGLMGTMAFFETGASSTSSLSIASSHSLRPDELALSCDTTVEVSSRPSTIYNIANSQHLGTPAKKSKAQSKVTSHVLTKGYLSSVKGLKAVEPSKITKTSQPNVTTVPSTAFSHLSSTQPLPPRADQPEGSATLPVVQPNSRKLTQMVVPSLSHSTMELSTFLNTTSNPPPFSAFTRTTFSSENQDLVTGSKIDAGVDGEEQPITDRFGFVVDAKYGMKLIRDSKKKQRNLKRASGESPDSTSGAATMRESEMREEAEEAPTTTTALPIKSQVDVEAELSSLRESLGLPTLPTPDAMSGGSSSSSSTGPGCVRPEEEGGNASIRRLLGQLNECQEVLERNLLAQWTAFIAKRRAKALKAHHVLSGGTATVSPESVGAFLGSSDRVDSASEASGNAGAGGRPKAMSVGAGSKPSGSATDLMLWHDENLIGIASMGIACPNTGPSTSSCKEDWRDFRALVMKGVPISLRPKIWLECSGANEVKEPGYYRELLGRHQGESGMALVQIECDVTRTLPTNVYFGGDGPGVNKLRRVLAAMSWHNPVVGYCQGMNMVAATLLLTIPDEEDAFWILVCIVDKILPSDYYTSHLISSQADQRVLKDLVERHLPELWGHFEGMEVELAAITFGWFLSLFADALPIQTLLRVFDVFLIDGSVMLFRVSMALLKMYRTEILRHDSPASLYAYMRGGMTLRSHDADKLMKVAVEEFSEIKTAEIVRLRSMYVAELRGEMGLSMGGGLDG